MASRWMARSLPVCYELCKLWMAVSGQKLDAVCGHGGQVRGCARSHGEDWEQS